MTTSTTSLLGEALHAGFERLCMLLQHEFGLHRQLTAGKLAQTLGFVDWDELCECAIFTTSRDIDVRLECLVEGHLRDDDFAERLASAFGTSASRMRVVLRDARTPDHAMMAS